MKKMPAAANPDAYVEALTGWRGTTVEALRAAVLSAASVDEVIKWGNIVYLASGPVAVIRAEDERVIFGFWRGQRMRKIEPRLKPGGKYEMANIELREGATVEHEIVKRLVFEGVRLNARLGDPTRL